MKQRITCMILLAGLVTMLAGCSEPFNGKTAGQVSFTISAKSSPDTKTAYSGDLVTENDKLYERINWVAGDTIRIYSSDKSQVGVGVVNHVDNPVDHYDYTIGSVITANGRKSDATVNKPAEGEGLTWVNDPYGVLFYGTYPPLAATYNNKGELQSFTGMTIPRDQTTTVDMDHAYMLAAPAQFVESTQLDESGNKIPKMHMDFYPAFNAFYIVLGSQIGEIGIDSIKLVTTTAGGYLSGSYSYNYPATQLTNGPIVNGVVYGSDNNNSVKVTLPSGTKIKPGEGSAAGDSVKVTLLTLPPQTGDLTNMVLNVYHDGKTKPASLKLNYSNGDPINFTAFHKARITGLAMEGNKWQLTVNGQVLPWDGYDHEVTAQISLQGKVATQGAIENTYQWQSTIGSQLDEPRHRVIDNHYEGDGNYNQFYQLRTLNTHSQADHYFTMTFTPTAPTGGYWELIPTFKDGDTESRKHFSFRLQDRPGGAWKEVGMDGLTGPILNSEVTIEIHPRDYEFSDTNIYYMWFNYYCRPTKTSSPMSGDSEFQDVHGDGRFSYWTFVLSQYNGDFDPTVPFPSN